MAAWMQEERKKNLEIYDVFKTTSFQRTAVILKHYNDMTEEEKDVCVCWTGLLTVHTGPNWMTYGEFLMEKKRSLK